MATNTMKRACIYFIYDRDGIIDDYIIDQLRDMRENVDFLHCVINGALTDEGRAALEQVADEVFVRENKGMDIGAYRGAIDHIGWDKLCEYDELVLMNNTCFGPVYPFREVFAWAEQQEAEVWGLTKDIKGVYVQGKDYLHRNDSPTFIQSYFLVVRKPLLGTQLLKDFFAEIPDELSYLESGNYYEYAFPGYFEERGYRSAVYCDDEDMDYPMLHDPVSLLRKYRIPLIKKRSFFHHYTDVLHHTAGEATVKMLDYLKAETDYDLSLIWKSVLRTNSLSDIVRCAQLNRILPADHVPSGQAHGTMRVGLVYHAYYDDLFEQDLHYIRSLEGLGDILITTASEEKKAAWETLLSREGVCAEVRVVENRGRDVSALLVGAADFIREHDLVCFAHDKKSSQLALPGVGRSWAYKLHENTLASKEYVQNVIDLFAREKDLGIAFPSMPNHDNYGYQLGSGWLGNFRNTQKLLERLGIRVKMHEHTLCVAPFGTCFWFRSTALQKLFDGVGGKGWSYRDFPCEPNRYDETILHAVERAYAYVAQAAGYYPVYLYTDRYAAIELTNLEWLKVGSSDMRGWTNALAMEAVGYLQPGSTDGYSAENVRGVFEPNVNYGVKQSLVNLAFALRCKYPRAWAFLLPLRRLSQKILRIRTK